MWIFHCQCLFRWRNHKPPLEFDPHFNPRIRFQKKYPIRGHQPEEFLALRHGAGRASSRAMWERRCKNNKRQITSTVATQTDLCKSSNHAKFLEPEHEHIETQIPTNIISTYMKKGLQNGCNGSRQIVPHQHFSLPLSTLQFESAYAQASLTTTMHWSQKERERDRGRKRAKTSKHTMF